MSRRKSRRAPGVPPRVGERPVVAILGRPNVGKSTLFNRLVGRRAAIVEDRPGVTRDRIYADADIDDKPITLVDMGGYEAAPEGEIEVGISRQCQVGLEEADLVLFVVDGRTPPTGGDHETADLLRRSSKPSILVINKIDGQSSEAEAGDAYALGLEPATLVSALHGRGISDLEDLMYERLPEPLPAPEDEEEEGVIRVAIVGRPNAGKSSLINHLLGEDRLLTLDSPGTTRDAVDSYFERGDQRYVLVDTAGIRRKRSVPRDGPEKLAVTAAVRAVERCHVAVVLVDSFGGIAEQDAKVLGLVADRGRALVIGLNKWDLMKGEHERAKRLKEQLEDTFSFAPWARDVKLSALTGRGTDKLLATVDAAYAEFDKRVPTGELNRLIENIIEHHPPPLRKGRVVKLFYGSQVRVRPPTFVVHTSYPEALHFSYRRYVQNRIRETFGFDGTPVRVLFKKRKRKGDLSS